MLLAGLRSQPAAAVLPAGAVAVVVAGLASVLLQCEQNRRVGKNGGKLGKVPSKEELFTPQSQFGF
eukprot:SAG31_NODE_256_length_19032_cov_5.305181_15_plen_66_part_00